jgi:hypothetical protein
MAPVISNSFYERQRRREQSTFSSVPIASERDTDEIFHVSDNQPAPPKAVATKIDLAKQTPIDPALLVAPPLNDIYKILLSITFFMICSSLFRALVLYKTSDPTYVFWMYGSVSSALVFTMFLWSMDISFGDIYGR